MIPKTKITVASPSLFYPIFIQSFVLPLCGTSIYIIRHMLTELLILLAVLYILLSLLFYFFPLLIHKRMQHSNPFFNRLLDSKGIICIAHRGGAYEGPENTIETFKQSEGVCHILEMDVCLTKDQKLVVCHDPILERLCDVKKEVSSFDYEKLPTLQKSYEPYGRKGEEDKKMPTNMNKMPLLETVFKEFPDKTINLQLKDFREKTMDGISKLAKEYKRENNIIWGMEGTQNRKLREVNPEIATICQPSEIIKLLLISLTGLLPFFSLRKAFLEIPLMCPQLWKNLKEDFPDSNKKRYAAIIQYYLVSFVSRIFVPHLRKRGILTFFWTINDEKGYAKAISIGAAGIMTDEPTKLANYLKNRDLYYGENKETV